ncbi:MAG: enoyl-CoA hydratase-related protein [Candidatus Nanopelagicales bacterium]|nr:enoyl-CoA hydratase-related protein [Candidatus Nanopelagicales bacterium]MDZ4248905.1 enoyl-CoA hydratase-related protein [Candidatus Nanopelagicales bacterium]
MSEPVLYEVADQVATITLNRPEARNALNAAALFMLRDALSCSADDADVRVVVLTGIGDTFCAGADVKAALSGDAGGFAATGPQAMADLMCQILDHPKPTIARVQGNVYGGGNGLLASCDLSVAVDTARFAFSEVRLGVTPAIISVVCLRKMAAADAAELCLLGERVSAQRVRSAGLINAVEPADGLDSRIAQWIQSLRLGGPNALTGTKELLRRVPGMPRDEAFAYTADLSGEYFRSAEAAEGMTALLQKRPPQWAAEA